MKGEKEGRKEGRKEGGQKRKFTGKREKEEEKKGEQGFKASGDARSCSLPWILMNLTDLPSPFDQRRKREKRKEKAETRMPGPRPTTSFDRLLFTDCSINLKQVSFFKLEEKLCIVKTNFISFFFSFLFPSLSFLAINRS